MIKNCIKCNNEFTVYPSELKKANRKYCSRECQKTGNTSENKICKHCGNTFSRKIEECNKDWRKHTYCKQSCWTSHRILTDFPKKECEVCHKPLILTKTVHIKIKRFCSRRCRSIYACAAGMKVNRNRNKRTSIEVKMAEVLKELNIPFEEQKIITNCKCMPDFYIPKTNTCLFTDGTYWHSGVKRQYRDKRINKRLEKSGYNVIRIWEHDINKDILNVKNKLISQLKNFEVVTAGITNNLTITN